MKTYTITLSKPGTDSQATATIVYRDASWPEEITWTGHQNEFRLVNGNLVRLACSMDRLRDVVEHQAQQAEADFTISDDGGEAPMRTDELIG